MITIESLAEVVQACQDLNSPHCLYIAKDILENPELKNQLEKLDMFVAHLDEFESITSKSHVLEAFDEKCKFTYFGFNWDALNDCLTAFDWFERKKGYIFMMGDTSNLVKQDLYILFGIAKNAHQYWLKYGISFRLIMVGNHIYESKDL